MDNQEFLNEIKKIVEDTVRKVTKEILNEAATINNNLMQLKINELSAKFDIVANMERKQESAQKKTSAVKTSTKPKTRNNYIKEQMNKKIDYFVDIIYDEEQFNNIRSECVNDKELHDRTYEIIKGKKTSQQAKEFENDYKIYVNKMKKEEEKKEVMEVEEKE